MWFSESGAEDAVLRQLDLLERDGILRRQSRLVTKEEEHASDGPAASRFLDLGTGNGHMLFALCEENDDGQSWHGDMVGVDYSQASVQLAQRIAKQRRLEAVRFIQWDLLDEAAGDWFHDGFDVVLDKGTFDAISLMPQGNARQHPCDIYREKVQQLVKPGLVLIVTSCNWTKDELIGWLAPDSGEMAYHSEAQYPSFTFGGKTGQSVVTLVFRRKGMAVAL